MDFSINSKFYHFMSKTADLMLLSILWVVTSLPVITLGASCTALYYCVVKVIREESGSVFRSFFHAFRSNFKQSTAVSVVAVMLCICATLVGSAVYAMAQNGETLTSIYFVYLILLGFGIAWLHYVISYIARFQAPLGTILKNTLAICILHLPASISMVLLLTVVCVIWILMLPASFMAIILLPSLYALISSFMLERIYLKYRSDNES
ncbi:MAG: YesL family protein [Faecousia sp.]